MKSYDGSDTDASFTFEDMFSVLMYYYGMTKEDILGSSRKFLMALYQKYVLRACENLGTSPTALEEQEGEQTQNNNESYPSEFVTFTQAQREKMISESGKSDEEYFKMFEKAKNNTKKS